MQFPYGMPTILDLICLLNRACHGDCMWLPYDISSLILIQNLTCCNSNQFNWPLLSSTVECWHSNMVILFSRPSSTLTRLSRWAKAWTLHLWMSLHWTGCQCIQSNAIVRIEFRIWGKVEDEGCCVALNNGNHVVSQGWRDIWRQYNRILNH